MTATRQRPDRSAANLPLTEANVVTKIGEAEISFGFRAVDKFAPYFSPLAGEKVISWA